MIVGPTVFPRLMGRTSRGRAFQNQKSRLHVLLGFGMATFRLPPPLNERVERGVEIPWEPCPA